MITKIHAPLKASLEYFQRVSKGIFSEQNKHQWRLCIIPYFSRHFLVNLHQSNIYFSGIAVPSSISKDSNPSDLLRHLTFQLRHLFSLRIFAGAAGFGVSRLLLVDLPPRLTAVEGVAPGAPGWEGSSSTPERITLDMIPMLFDAICQGPIDGFLGGVFNPGQLKNISQIGSYHLL